MAAFIKHLRSEEQIEKNLTGTVLIQGLFWGPESIWGPKPGLM
jgi:hypothetical protein